jgi:glutaminyl-peptide cyclotransferase
MNKIFISIISIFLLLTSCQKKAVFQINVNGKPQQNKDFDIKINNINQTDIDKIDIYIDNQAVKTDLPYSENPKLRLNDNYKLGEHQIKINFKKNGEILADAQHRFDLYSSVKPKIWSYKLIHTYPHDIEAFTQGLEFYKDTLYESTGLNGESSLRKTDVKTGKIYKKTDLDKRFFGEGITIMNNKIYQLTWQNGIGFIYDTNLHKTGEFPYKNSKEGWGLCHDDKVIYKSDGTEKIWILDPETLEEKDYISIYTDKHRINRINEMEWVNGKIYTNVWQKNALAIINPQNGAVEGILNLSDLHKKVTHHPKLDVLNGIAYEPKTGHLFVTGKKWDKMFEIEVIQK